MFGLSHLFYPWGFLVQIFAIVHFVRRRPENYWFYVIFFGGWLGGAVYIVAEVIPDLGLLRGVFQGFGRRSRIQKVETDILDNPSPANYEELGELYKDQGQFEKAQEAFTKAIAARGDSIYTFYSRALCSLGLNDLDRAVPLFAEVTQISTTPETLYNYASFLKTVNRPDEAREWAQKLQAKKRTLPRYMQRRERPWFRKGKALIKELASA